MCDAALIDERAGRIGDNGRSVALDPASSRYGKSSLLPSSGQAAADQGRHAVQLDLDAARSAECGQGQRRPSAGIRWWPTDRWSNSSRTGSNSLSRRQGRFATHDAVDQLDLRRRDAADADSHRVAAQRSLQIEKRHAGWNACLRAPALRIVSVVRSKCSRSARRISNSAQASAEILRGISSSISMPLTDKLPPATTSMLRE